MSAGNCVLKSQRDVKSHRTNAAHEARGLVSSVVGDEGELLDPAPNAETGVT